MSTPPGIPGSSIALAVQWLFSGMRAVVQPAPDADGLLVCVGEPGTYQPQDVVYIDGVRQTYRPEMTTGSGGALWLREDYEITVKADVYRGGDDQIGVLMRARQIIDQVVGVIRADPSMGGSVTRARPASAEHTFGWAATDTEHSASGRRAEITLVIDVFTVL